MPRARSMPPSNCLRRKGSRAPASPPMWRICASMTSWLVAPIFRPALPICSASRWSTARPMRARLRQAGSRSPRSRPVPRRMAMRPVSMPRRAWRPARISIWRVPSAPSTVAIAWRSTAPISNRATCRRASPAPRRWSCAGRAWRSMQCGSMSVRAASPRPALPGRRSTWLSIFPSFPSPLPTPWHQTLGCPARSMAVRPYPARRRTRRCASRRRRTGLAPPPSHPSALRR